jgi:hypothetical protein
MWNRDGKRRMGEGGGGEREKEREEERMYRAKIFDDIRVVELAHNLDFPLQRQQPLVILIWVSAEVGVWVQGSGFKVQGSGFKVQGSGFKVQGSGFRVQGSRLRVQG